MMQSTLTKTLLVLTFAAPAALAGHHASKDMTSSKNIVETAASAGQFQTLIAAAKAGGLVSALSGEGPLTVFAPTDEAFNALPAGTVESLLKPENKSQLARILKFHVVAGDIGSNMLADGATVETLAGPVATIAAAEQGFTIEGARIVATDIKASNGVVHVIDRVILPPEPVTRAAASEMIENAIARGAPKYNHGQAAATVAIYRAALTSLKQSQLNGAEMRRIERGLSSANHSANANDAAWELRYALDDVYASLSGHSQTRITMTR